MTIGAAVGSGAARIETTFREEHGRVLAALISQFGDFTLADDALERWAIDAVPRNPGAWLTIVARRRAIDRRRHNSTQEREAASLNARAADDVEEESEMETIPDDRLKLMFTCCRPSLALEAQVALTPHTLGGLSAPEIARAFLVPVATMAQRLARARANIRGAGIPYRVPPADLLPERLDALLAVIYLIFNEGYCATGGDRLTRGDLYAEAIRLGRVLVDLLPGSAEASGILALLLLHDSRRETRLDAAGDLVLLDDQDRTRWDRAKIAEGSAILDDALRLHAPGAYQVQAAISALHAEAAMPDATDWPQIAALYGTLAALAPSPVVEVNRAVAVAMAQGPAAGLRLLHRIEGVADFYPYHVARAELLRRTDQQEAAAEAYERTLDLCQNSAERAFLQRRLDQLLKAG